MSVSLGYRIMFDVMLRTRPRECREDIKIEKKGSESDKIDITGETESRKRHRQGKRI